MMMMMMGCDGIKSKMLFQLAVGVILPTVDERGLLSAREQGSSNLTGCRVPGLASVDRRDCHTAR